MARSRPLPSIGQNLVIADPVKRQRFIQALRTGVPVKHAAAHAGMSERTVHRTLARGLEIEQRILDGDTDTLTDEDILCYEFFRDKEEARSAPVVRNTALMAQAATGGQLLDRRTLPNGQVEERYAPVDWRASWQILKMSYPREFAESARTEVELSGPNRGPITIESPELHAMSERLRSRLTDLEARKADDQAAIESAEIVDAELVDDTADVVAAPVDDPIPIIDF